MSIKKQKCKTLFNTDVFGPSRVIKGVTFNLSRLSIIIPLGPSCENYLMYIVGIEHLIVKDFGSSYSFNIVL